LGGGQLFSDILSLLISQYTKERVEVLQGVKHMGAVVGKEVRPVIKEWVKQLSRIKHIFV